MTRHRWMAGLALAIGLAVGEAEAQPVARSFDGLRDDLKSGDIVIVLDGTGNSVWGQVDELSSGSVSLFTGERVGAGASFPKTSRRVFSENVVVEIRRSDSNARPGVQLFYRPVAGRSPTCRAYSRRATSSRSPERTAK